MFAYIIACVFGWVVMGQLMDIAGAQRKRDMERKWAEKYPKNRE